MKQTEYAIASPSEREDVVDLINYVFSQAHRPHDFKKLYPNVYADHWSQLNAKHFIARQDGRIRALIACHPLRLHVLDRVLNAGCVGNVSVHPYSRGEGHMKHLMAEVEADARVQGYDLLLLNGQRQRYNYFGFEQAGWIYRYDIEAASVRHCLGALDTAAITLSPLSEERTDEMDFALGLFSSQPVYGERTREEFPDVLRAGSRPSRLIRVNGEMAGYITGAGVELVLRNEALLTGVIKALFEQEGIDHMSLIVAPHQRQRMDILAPISSSRSVEWNEMIHVLNWRTVLEALLRLRASFLPLRDGRLSLIIDSNTLVIRVMNGEVSVSEEATVPDFCLGHLQAERAIFGLEAFATGGLFENWFPLPFFIPPLDEF